MKAIPGLVCLIGALLFCLHPIYAADASKETVEFRIVVELQDGSKIIGKSGDETFQFLSDVLGELKLPVARIRTIECQPRTNAVKLATVNGDSLAGRMMMKHLQVEAAFGSFKLPVDMIRRIHVSKLGKPAGRPNLVALWSGESNGDDLAGGNNSTLMKDVLFADGKVGQAFSLNGSGAHLKIPASPNLDVGNGGGFTVTAWIKPTDVSAYHPIVEWNDGTPEVGVHLWITRQIPERGVLYANLMDINGAPHILQSPVDTLVAGSFQHVALTYDRETGSGKLYVNGRVVDQKNLGSFRARTTHDFWISHRPSDRQGHSTFNSFFAGLLDEVAIYDRALSADELQEICISENQGGPLPPPPPPKAKPEIERPRIRALLDPPPPGNKLF